MKNAVRIAMLLDRSGSMESSRESTIKGINTFVAEQKKSLADGSMVLAQFDNNIGFQYNVIFDKPITEVPELTQADFVPRGSTPLLDAQGRLISDLGEELSLLPESERPDKIIVVTVTDGYENASTDYTREKIKSMIEHQTKVYNWDFVYIGANQDAIATGLSMGYQAGKTMNYNAASGQTVGATFKNLSAYATRSGSVADPARMQYNSFSSQERSSSMEEDETLVKK